MTATVLQLAPSIDGQPATRAPDTPAPDLGTLLEQVRPTASEWPPADWERLRPGGRRTPTVWCQHGTPGCDTPWYALTHHRLVRATAATMDPRWWRAQLGPVALRLDLYPVGTGTKHGLRTRTRLVELGLGDEERPLVEPVPHVVVVLQDGTPVRAALGPMSFQDGVPVYHQVPGAWFPDESSG